MKPITQNNLDEKEDYSLFNVKGTHAKKQVNKEKKSVNPTFRVK